MHQPISPLQLIHQKEVELERRFEEARQQAEADLRAAREEARQMIAQADRTGQAEAEAIYQQGIDQVRKETEVILAAANEEATTLRRQVRARLDDVAIRILQLVLPPETPHS